MCSYSATLIDYISVNDVSTTKSRGKWQSEIIDYFCGFITISRETTKPAEKFYFKNRGKSGGCKLNFSNAVSSKHRHDVMQITDSIDCFNTLSDVLYKNFDNKFPVKTLKNIFRSAKALD